MNIFPPHHIYESHHYCSLTDLYDKLYIYILNIINDFNVTICLYNDNIEFLINNNNKRTILKRINFFLNFFYYVFKIYEIYKNFNSYEIKQ